MHSLIVVAHPNSRSLTHAIAQRIAHSITASNPQHSTELADLMAEGFDPRFNLVDQALFLKQSAPPADVAAEQERLDRADALVIVYPIYWWSFPAVLKGCLPFRPVHSRILQVHLVAVGGADEGTYVRHGYTPAMKAQIDHGIFDYCGANVRGSHVLLPSDGNYPQAHLDTAHAIGASIFALQAPNTAGQSCA